MQSRRCAQNRTKSICKRKHGNALAKRLDSTAVFRERETVNATVRLDDESSPIISSFKRPLSNIAHYYSPQGTILLNRFIKKLFRVVTTFRATNLSLLSKNWTQTKDNFILHVFGVNPRSSAAKWQLICQIQSLQLARRSNGVGKSVWAKLNLCWDSLQLRQLLKIQFKFKVDLCCFVLCRLLQLFFAYIFCVCLVRHALSKEAACFLITLCFVRFVV